MWTDKYRPALVCLALGATLLAQAQRRNANWLTANNWIHFQDTGPVIVPNGSSSRVGASLSDTEGVLLLYGARNSSDGLPAGIRDGGQALISDQPPSWLMAPSIGTPQRVIFIPKPGSSDRVYMFMWFENNDQGGLLCEFGHIEIQTATDGSAASVIDANFTMLPGAVVGKRMAIPHANGQDYWLVTHSLYSPEYRAYLISSSGVGAEPVISAAGAPVPELWRHGKMIASGAGDHFASVSEEPNCNGSFPDTAMADLLSFDRNTGQVTLLHGLAGLKCVKGAEFSPSGRFMYIAELRGQEGSGVRVRSLYQYDLETGDIEASRMLLHEYTTSSVHAISSNVLALAPNGMIYEAGEVDDHVLGVVQVPDLQAPDCAYVDEGLTCQAPWTTLPAPMKSYHDSPAVSGLGVDEPSAFVVLRVRPNPAADRVHLQGLPSNAARAIVRDVLGRLAFTVRSSLDLLNVSDLHSGIYTIEVQDRDGMPLGLARFMRE